MSEASIGRSTCRNTQRPDLAYDCGLCPSQRQRHGGNAYGCRKHALKGSDIILGPQAVAGRRQPFSPRAASISATCASVWTLLATSVCVRFKARAIVG